MILDPIVAAIKTRTTLEKVYHAQALKNASAPFVFWIQQREETETDLNGVTELHSDAFDFHCVAGSLSALESLSANVKAAVLSLQGTAVGGYLFQRVAISMISPEIHEKEVGLYRKVYSVTINYIEVPQEPPQSGAPDGQN